MLRRPIGPSIGASRRGKNWSGAESRAVVPTDLPGAAELQLMCKNARRVLELCDLVGLEGGSRYFPEEPNEVPWQAASESFYDPDVHPYWWEL